MERLSVEDRITKVKIQLQKENPFFSYLLLFTKIEKSDKIDTIGVFPNDELYYNPKFIEKLDDDELKTVLIHEVLHLAFQHLSWGRKILERNGLYGKKFFHLMINLAQDLTINCILKKNGFKFPPNCVLPDQYDRYTFFVNRKMIMIENVSKKNFDVIFDEILKQLPKNKGYGGKKGRGKKKGNKGVNVDVDVGENFDEELDYDKAKPMDSEEERKKREKWNKIFREALAIAKMRGKGTLGLERMIEMGMGFGIDWKKILIRNVRGYFPHSLTYQKPNSKKDYTDFIFPSIKKKGYGDILVVIDTSGSMSEDELKEILGEICRIAKIVRVKVRIIQHDYEVVDDRYVKYEDVVSGRLKIKGGGGTSFSNVVEYIKKNKIKYRVLVWFTDGYGNEFEKLKNMIFVLNSDYDECVKGKGKVIKVVKNGE